MHIAFSSCTMQPLGTAASVDAARWSAKHWGDGADDFLIVFDLPDTTARAVLDPRNAHRVYKMLKRHARHIVWRGADEAAQTLFGGK